MTQYTGSLFGLMIRITLKDGKTVEFRDSRIQWKDQGQLVAVFDKKYRILAEFPSEDVLECLEGTDPEDIPASEMVLMSSSQAK